MTRQELFDIWAPSDSVWSQWVSPAFFAQADCADEAIATKVNPAVWYEQKASPNTAVIVDLAGVDSVRLAVTLAERGYRPILVVNASPGPVLSQPNLLPSPVISSSPFVVLDMAPLIRELWAQTGRMRRCTLAANAPPAFILDAMRLRGTRPLHDDLFDNRWMVFAQDFPSASFLMGQGITRVIVVQAEKSQPQEDLSQVLLGWQDKEIEIYTKTNGDANPPSRITVTKPSKLRTFWNRVLILAGLRQSSVGGFGSIFPKISSAG